MPEVTSDRNGLAVAISNAAAREVIWREFDGYAVARQHTDVVRAHFAGEVTENCMTVFEFDPKHGVRQRIDDLAVDGDRVRILAARALLDDGPWRGGRVPNWLTIGWFLWQSMSP